MAQRTKSNFKSTKDARFADNVTGDISAADSRDTFEDLADSTMFISDNFIDEDSFASDSATKAPSQQSTKAYIDARFTVVEVNVTSSIDLDMNGLQTRAFKGSENITANKNVTITNDSNAISIGYFKFECNASVQLTFESDVRHQAWDGAWNSETGFIWTAPADGQYIMKAYKVDGLWFVEPIIGPFVNPS